MHPHCTYDKHCTHAFYCLLQTRLKGFLVCKFVYKSEVEIKRKENYFQANRQQARLAIDMIKVVVFILFVLFINLTCTLQYTMYLYLNRIDMM